MMTTPEALVDEGREIAMRLEAMGLLAAATMENAESFRREGLDEVAAACDALFRALVEAAAPMRERFETLRESFATAMMEARALEQLLALELEGQGHGDTQ